MQGQRPSANRITEASSRQFQPLGEKDEMAYFELAAAVYLGLLTVTLNTDGYLNTLLLKAPAPILGMFVAVDAMSRLGWIANN